MGWVPHEAHSETRIRGQVVYLGDDSRKHSREDGKGDTERKRAHKGHVARELLLWATGAQHPWRGGTGRPQRTSRVLSPWKERKLRYSSTNSIHHLGGAVSRDKLLVTSGPYCLLARCPSKPEQSPHSESHRCSNEHPFVYRD